MTIMHIFKIQNMSSVHVKEVVLVTASEPTPTESLRLSALDSQLFLRFTIEYLLVYKPRQGLDEKATTTARIKAALGHALVPYYPFAGRVRAREDGSGLEVVCRNQGAVFIQASSDYSSSEFESTPRYCNRWRKLLSLQVTDVLKGAPPLVVQLTWLSDGGATLAVGFSHCLCDGIGSADFLNFFAALASCKRGEAELNETPVWARHLADPRAIGVPCCNWVNHPEFKKVPDLCGFLSRFSQERLVPTSVAFDKNGLSELKKLAMLVNPSANFSASFTSFEVLSAHVWRSWAKALHLPSKQVLKLLFSINIRNRVKPSLPGSYYGNAFVLGCAQTSVKDLVEKGLGHAAELIKRAKERVDDTFVREVVESVSSERACPDSVGVLILSQWSRLGLDRVDFGMGRPVNVGPICSDRYCLLLPIYDRTDDVKVNLAVPASGVDHYLQLLRTANA